jgi:hypothetical protein
MPSVNLGGKAGQTSTLRLILIVAVVVVLLALVLGMLL